MSPPAGMAQTVEEEAAKKNAITSPMQHWSFLTSCLLFSSFRCSATHTRESSSDSVAIWYQGYVGVVPAYILTAVRPLNLVNYSVQFACSTASYASLRLEWQAPNDTEVSIERRESRTGRGNEILIQESLISLTSSRPGWNVVRCKVFSGSGGLVHSSREGHYEFREHVSVRACEERGVCYTVRSSCAFDPDQGLVCVCNEAFPHRDPFHGVCFSGKVKDEVCVFPHECKADDPLSTCLHGVCGCTLPFVADRKECKKVAQLRYPCDNLTLCLVPESECRHEVCACRVGWEETRGSCTRLPPGGHLHLKEYAESPALPLFVVVLIVALVAIHSVYHHLTTWLHTKEAWRHTAPRAMAGNKDSAPLSREGFRLGVDTSVRTPHGSPPITS